MLRIIPTLVPVDSQLKRVGAELKNFEKPTQWLPLVQAFFDAGWTQENLVDAIVVIGDKTVTNYLHGTTRVPVDFPAAPPLAA